MGEILNAHPQITLANVYGIDMPGVEGRAGMVVLALGERTQFDVAGFQSLVERSLPPYILPAFVRILRAVQTTGTFKLLKGELREQSYHLER